MDYNQEAKTIIKAEIARKNMNYQQITQLLQEKGINENKMNIANKLSCGKFNFAYTLQTLDVLRTKNLRLKD